MISVSVSLYVVVMFEFIGPPQVTQGVGGTPDWYIIRADLGLCPANERRCYFVMTSLIGWAQT